MKMTNKKYIYITIIIIFSSIMIGILLNKDRFVSKPASIHPYKHNFPNQERLNFIIDEQEFLTIINNGIKKYEDTYILASYNYNHPYTDSSNRIKNHFLFSQMCLFYKNKQCENIIFMSYGINQDDNDFRKDFYTLNNEPNFSKMNYLSEKDKYCKIIYYKTQDNLNDNKQLFLDNYQYCKSIYMAHLSSLKNYEQLFLSMFN